MSKVTISTMTATQDPIPKDLRGLAVETLQNLQTDLNPVPDQHLDTEYWPDNEILPTFDSDIEKQGSIILTPDEPTKVVNITYNVDALDAGELAGVLAARKPPKLKLLKAEGLRRIQLVMPAITDYDALDLVREQWLSILPAARDATPNFQLLIDVVTAGKAAASDVNAMTDVATIDAYDVTAAPGWPV